MERSVNKGSLPLEGLVVLDFTRLLPGPVCTMLLADYGAEVIKVEDVRGGDPARYAGNSSGKSALFYQVNRNKKSIAVNLKNDSGREAVKKIAARVDILVEGFRPGVMERLGLGYEDLSKINEQLIYASISGYGKEGVYRNRAGHDLNYSALTGLLDLSAEEDGPPVMPAVQIADIAGGSLMALNGIMFALFKRMREGKGEHVDVSMARGLLPFLAYAASGQAESGELPRRGKGLITGAFACYNLYETADGKYMSLGALEPVFWQRFCETVGKPDWIDRQFDQEKRTELIEQVKQLFKKRSRSEWEETFAKVDACCEPVLDLNEAREHPLASQEGYFLKGPAGDFMTGFPLLFSGQGGELRLDPPGHGEHTVNILNRFGFGKREIEELKQKKAIKE